MAQTFNVEAQIADVLKEIGRVSYKKMCETIDASPDRIKSILKRWEYEGVIVGDQSRKYSLCSKP
jgi:DNA-binding Lrp family transcriptional regulator